MNGHAEASSCDSVPGYAPPCPGPGTHHGGTAFTGAGGDITVGFALVIALVAAAAATRITRWRARA